MDAKEVEQYVITELEGLIQAATDSVGYQPDDPEGTAEPLGGEKPYPKVIFLGGESPYPKAVFFGGEKPYPKVIFLGGESPYPQAVLDGIADGIESLLSSAREALGAQPGQ